MILRTVKVTIGTVRDIIREHWYLERYENQLTNDKSFKKKGVYVPDDTKRSIKKWLEDMGLAGKSDTR